MSRPVRAQACALLAATLLASALPACAEVDSTTETVILIRHGEKPENGLGQLDCQGLNRALALPKVIKTLFGRPDAIFAPDPARSKPDHFKSYDYVRPLATVEPSAVQFALPVNTQIGWSDRKALEDALRHADLRNAVVLVAWEHLEIVGVAQELLAGNGGDKSQVPDWPSDDFDRIYVIRIVRSGKNVHATFEREQQHLDGLSTTCPGSA